MHDAAVTWWFDVLAGVTFYILASVVIICRFHCICLFQSLTFVPGICFTTPHPDFSVDRTDIYYRHPCWLSLESRFHIGCRGHLPLFHYKWKSFEEEKENLFMWWWLGTIQFSPSISMYTHRWWEVWSSSFFSLFLQRWSPNLVIMLFTKETSFPYIASSPHMYRAVLRLSIDVIMMMSALKSCKYNFTCINGLIYIIIMLLVHMNLIPTYCNKMHMR